MSEATYRETIARIGKEYHRGLMTDEEFIERILMVNAEFFGLNGK